MSEALWRVCRVIKGDCRQCAATVIIDDEPYTPGCYLHAQEAVNTVETGNPWRKTEGVKAPWVALSTDHGADAPDGEGGAS